MMIRHVLAVLNPRYRFRDAVSGHFVRRAYALLHPSTTVRERIDARDEGDHL
jgi:hypothetical protein